MYAPFDAAPNGADRGVHRRCYKDFAPTELGDRSAESARRIPGAPGAPGIPGVPGAHGVPNGSAP
jgi:hypothetical protein